MIHDLKPYPVMKDSGVPWLGKVPEHWEVRKLRQMLNQNTRRNRPDLPLLSVVREKGVIKRDVTSKDENYNYIPDDLSNYKVVRSGQFAMNKMKAWQGSYGISKYDGIVSPAYFVFDVDGIGGEFFHVAIRSKVYVPFFTQASDGVRIGQWDLSQARMQEIPFSVPPLPEQLAIVRSLDYVNRRIQRYIRAKQKLIKLLEEQRQAIIHRAVTRGLDPNVRLKPSGVEWLGYVPEHWEILRGKYVGKLFSTPSILDNDLTENGDNHPMYLKVRDLSHVDAKLKITKSVLYVKSRKVVAHRQDRAFLVFPKRGGAIYTNKVAIVEADFLLDPNLMGWEIGDRFDPHYVALLLKTRTLADLADVSSVPQLNNKHINPISFPAPTLTEQIAIISRLDSDLVGLNATISRTHHAISLLREYRTRLIADVVTGKFDVRDAAARLPDEAEEPEPLDEADALSDAEEETEMVEEPEE